MGMNTPRKIHTGEKTAQDAGTVTNVDRRDVFALNMTEAQLQEAIIELATVFQWTVFHARDSRRQRLVGLPDLLLLRPPGKVTPGRAMWWELKTQQGKLTPIQQATIDLLTACEQDARVVRPLDWLQDRVADWLK